MDGGDGDLARRSSADADENEDGGVDPGHPGSIPPEGRERRTRRRFLSASIYAGRLQTTATSSTATAAVVELGGERASGDPENRGGTER